MKVFSVIIAAACLGLSACAQSQTIESGPFHWDEFGADLESPGETSKLFEGSSDAFEYLYIAVTNVGAGESFTLPHDNEDLEALLIMKSGTLDQKIKNDQKQMGRGSVSLLMPGENIGVKNNSPDLATLYVIMWRAKRTDDGISAVSTDNANSLLVDWNDTVAVKIEKGERRYLIQQRTAMMDEFRMHVTTLNEGMTSHLPHTHIDEEILLIRNGEVEEHIDGELHEVEAGSLIFLRSMVPHGIRNIGQGQSDYYAFRWVPKTD